MPLKCIECKYWREENFRLTPNGQNSADTTRTSKAGSCRFDSPWPQNNFRIWPITVEDDWCYRFQEKEKTVEVPKVEPTIMESIGNVVRRGRPKKT